MSAKVKNGLTKKHLFGYGMGDLGGCMTFGSICHQILHECFTG